MAMFSFHKLWCLPINRNYLQDVGMLFAHTGYIYFPSGHDLHFRREIHTFKDIAISIKCFKHILKGNTGGKGGLGG